jgi:hypothetical protein
MLLVVGVAGHIPWPPSSPNLTPYCLPMGICETAGIPYSIATVPSRASKIREGVANVDVSQLWRTWKEFKYRVDVGGAANGVYIEYLNKYFFSFLVDCKLFHICIHNRFENMSISFHSDIVYILAQEAC